MRFSKKKGYECRQKRKTHYYSWKIFSFYRSGPSDNQEDAGQIEELVKRKQKELRDSMKNFSPVKNLLFKEFEVRTHKDIRACAVKSVCDAMKSAQKRVLFSGQ